MSDQRNLFIAIALSLTILVGFQFFYEIPRQEKLHEQRSKALIEESNNSSEEMMPGRSIPNTDMSMIPGVPSIGEDVGPIEKSGAAREEAINKSRRVKIDAPRLQGTISLTGGRIDDLILRDYKVSIEEGSSSVTLFSPTGSPNPYYANFGWSAADLRVPDSKSNWRASSQTLVPGRPLILTWDNDQGVRFKRIIEVDNDFLFTVTQRVENNSEKAVKVYPYGLISRTGMPDTLGFYILHEGPLGVFNETLTEVDYDDLEESPQQEIPSSGGWIGVTDKFWLAALVPDQSATNASSFRYSEQGGKKRYQTDYIYKNPIEIGVGFSAEVKNRLFAGAKEVKLLDKYAEAHNIPRFDLAVDFGWFYFLTKPLFYFLDYFFQKLGNFGLAILALTVVIKLFFFPLANKSYKAMSKMKGLQPEMNRLRERHGSDRQKLNQSMMELYKREKVNPAAGCLPILIQIPVFFALYKVMFVTIEMRHQPFFGWIQDLSAPDPTSLFNLFGLIPWDVPTFLMIGIWPILMGASMYMQQLLNPQPADPIQAKIFLFMPLFFTFLLATFPAGLVIYWTWNNILSIAQQWVIMRRMGVPIGNAGKKSGS